MGRVEFLAVPLPNWPPWLKPQHFAEPPLITAQVESGPAATPSTFTSGPAPVEARTVDGRGRRVLVPSPI